VGDAVDGLEQLYNAATGRQVDPVLAVLSAVGLAIDLSPLGLADVSAGVKAAYRISLAFSRQGGGLVAEVIRAQFVQFAAGRLSPRVLVNSLQQRFARIIELARLRVCGGFSLNNTCLLTYDRLGLSYKSARNLDNTTSLRRLDEDIDDPSYTTLGLNKKDALDDLAACPIGQSRRPDLIGPQALSRTDFKCPNILRNEEVSFGVLNGPLAGKTVRYKRPLEVQETIGPPFPTREEAQKFGKVLDSGRRLRDAGAIYDAGGIIDDACHIIPKALKGKGSKNNIFPCESFLNSRVLRPFEQQLKKTITELGEPIVLKVRFDYEGSATPLRPRSITYVYTKLDGTPISLPGYGTSFTAINPTVRGSR
jgi:hypothetical protein